MSHIANPYNLPHINIQAIAFYASKIIEPIKCEILKDNRENKQKTKRVILAIQEKLCAMHDIQLHQDHIQDLQHNKILRLGLEFQTILVQQFDEINRLRDHVSFYKKALDEKNLELIICQLEKMNIND